MKENQKIATDWEKKLTKLREKHRDDHIEHVRVTKTVFLAAAAAARRSRALTTAAMAISASAAAAHTQAEHEKIVAISGGGSVSTTDSSDTVLATKTAAEIQQEKEAIEKEEAAAAAAAVDNMSAEELEDGLENLETLSENELEALKTKEKVDDLKRKVSLFEAEVEKLKGSVNMTSLLDYLRRDADYRARLEDLEAITGERNTVRKKYEDLRRQRLEDFMGGFGAITLKLKEMYQMITLGGDAELELVDSLDPFSEGIVFSVRPPKKSWKNISNLSGGEKTLSSLALVSQSVSLL